MHEDQTPIGAVPSILFAVGFVVALAGGSIVGIVLMLVAVAIGLHDSHGPRRRPPTPQI